MNLDFSKGRFPKKTVKNLKYEVGTFFYSAGQIQQKQLGCLSSQNLKITFYTHSVFSSEAFWQ